MLVGRGLAQRLQYIVGGARLPNHMLARGPLRAAAGEPVGTVPPIKPTVKVSPPRPKTHRLRNFSLFVTAAVATVYGAGGYIAIDNDTVYDYFTRYLPGGYDVVDFFESQRKKDPVYSPQHAHTVTERATAKIHRDAAEAKATVQSAGAEIKQRVAELAPKRDQEPVAPVARTGPPKQEAALSNITGRNFDSTLSPVVKALNSVIQSVNSGRATDADIGDLTDAIQGVSQILADRRKHVEEEIHQRLKKQGESFNDELIATKKRLVDVYNERLSTEIQAARANVLAEANNRIQSQYVELKKELAKRVQSHVDAERDGRWSKLDELSKQLRSIETAVVDSGKAIADNDKVVNFHTQVGRLRSTLAGEATSLAPLLDSIKEALPEDPLVAAAIKAVPKDVQEHGVLSTSQLAARFAAIAPQIRKASLVPPDAGLGGHILSSVLSAGLVPKQGLPVGDDIESVLARTKTYLSEGRTLDAVYEVNSLKGWPKQIAGDWLNEGRKRSEVEFLTEILGEEGFLHSSSQGNK